MKIDPGSIHDNDFYKLIIGAVVPRPIAWVSTISKDGVLNLAPFSFFTVASRNPFTLCFSVGPGVEERAGTEKDTLVNIRDVKEFVINIVNVATANAMFHSSGNFPPEADEFALSGVTPEPSDLVRPPRVKESPINIECRLDRIVQVGTDSLILGQVLRYHIRDELVDERYRVDLNRLQALGRLPNTFFVVDNWFTLPRPDFVGGNKQAARPSRTQTQ